MIREILKFGDPVLRRKCEEVTAFDRELGVLLDDMYETMREADGIGLAAPQVGVLRRVVVIDLGKNRIELVNPVITAFWGKQFEPEVFVARGKARDSQAPDARACQGVRPLRQAREVPRTGIARKGVLS